MPRITRRRIQLRQLEKRRNRIKRILEAIGIVAFYCAIFVFLRNVSGNNTNSYYRIINNPHSTTHYELVTEREVSCVAVDKHTLEDTDGNLWEVSDCLKIGEEYSVVFSDNATPGKITDDEIKYIKGV